MGSLIAALNDQNIGAANAETLGDVYAANPANSGYTDNPFGYDASPAVIQTAYPKYGYNATAPQTPESYEDYDLTSLFGMLEKMKKPQDDRPSLSDLPPLPPGHPLVAPAQYTPGNPTTDPTKFATTPSFNVPQPPLPPGHPLVAPAQYNPNPQPVTPGGILAEAGKVQTGVQPVQPGLPPVPGAYTVPGAPTAPADTTAEDQAAAQAAEDARIQKMFAEQMAANDLANAQRQYQTYALDTGRSVEAGQTFKSAGAARDAQRNLQEEWKNLIQSG